MSGRRSHSRGARCRERQLCDCVCLCVIHTECGFVRYYTSRSHQLSSCGCVADTRHLGTQDCTISGGREARATISRDGTPRARDARARHPGTPCHHVEALRALYPVSATASQYTDSDVRPAPPVVMHRTANPWWPPLARRLQPKRCASPPFRQCVRHYAARGPPP